MFEALAILLAATVNSYHVGNSLTADGTGWLGAISQQAGALNYAYGVHIDGNQSLDTIWSNPAGINGVDRTRQPFGRWDNALSQYQWDHVVLQPWYGWGATVGSQKQAVASFIDYTRQNPANANTVFYVYQFWLLQSWGDYSTFWNYPIVTTDSTLMLPRENNYRYIMDWARATYASQGILVREIPTSEVWYQVSRAISAGEITGITMADLYRDDLHASWNLGRYLAAAVTYSTLTQTNLTGTAAPGPLLQIYPQSLFDKLHAISWRVITSDADTGLADFNNDAYLDVDDLATWQSSYGTAYTGRDFLMWQRAYRQPRTMASVAVPEPSALLLSAAAFLSGLSTLVFRRAPCLASGEAAPSR